MCGRVKGCEVWLENSGAVAAHHVFFRLSLEQGTPAVVSQTPATATVTAPTDTSGGGDGTLCAAEAPRRYLQARANPPERF